MHQHNQFKAVLFDMDGTMFDTERLIYKTIRKALAHVGKKDLAVLYLNSIGRTDEDIVFKDIEDEVDKKLIDESIGKLKKREKNIMELRFGFKSGVEKTQKEVADMLGISQSYISRLEKRIIGRMKKEIKMKI